MVMMGSHGWFRDWVVRVSRCTYAKSLIHSRTMKSGPRVCMVAYPSIIEW
jgi:hypothetical protein